jgi:YVTN family beta-propeller protein
MRHSAAVLCILLVACRASQTTPSAERPRLPTGQHLDPAGIVTEVGQMPLAMTLSPAGRRIVLLLNGYSDQGVQVVDRTGQVTQTIRQEAAFIGLAFSADGRTLFASGGNTDVVYRYRWDVDSASLQDSLVLATKRRPQDKGTHYPAGLALSRDGRRLYVAENLADSLAVIDLSSGNVVQRVATGRYPYGVAVTPDGTVFVSNWGASVLSVFTPGPDGGLRPAPALAAGRHPSALLLNASGTRLFVASGSTDRIAVVDTRARRVVAELADDPPGNVVEGATPNALALSADGTRLFAAEGDANAVAVFDLSAATSDVASAAGNDRLQGRVPAGWYPTSLAAAGDTLIVANGKGAATAPNPHGRRPGLSRTQLGYTALDARRSYTLGQIRGSLMIAPLARVRGADLAALSARVAHANNWSAEPGAPAYPPFEHVVYIIRENRTYDQLLGDLPGGDGDTSLVFFGQPVTPNYHALAQRFGIFDRFFVNAEVSADGHNWSMAAFATDYTQKTTATNYGGDGRTYDYEGENRDTIPEEDVAEPAAGYLWGLVDRAGLTFRDFGEFTREEAGEWGDKRYRGTKAIVAAHNNPEYPNFDLHIPDQRRVDIWQEEFRGWVDSTRMPSLAIIQLPRDHTSGAAAGYETPKAMVADNDLALGRVVEAISSSPFWRSTVIFVLEDDAQDGPDHVDSHRSPLLVISAWNRQGVYHRFTNTTDVLLTIEEILKLDHLSTFDRWGRPLRDIWASAPDTTPYHAVRPQQPLDEMNPSRTRGAIESRRLDLAHADAADMDLFNHILWRAIKGDSVPYPGSRRMSLVEMRRSR